MDINDPDVLKEGLTSFIKQNLETDVSIESVHKLEVKTYLVKFGNKGEKWKVMKNKFKLRNMNENKIYINDRTKGEMEIGGKIRARAKEEGNNGKSVRIEY